jgi:hypothetical protein
VPWSFVEVWKRANLPHCGVKISSGGKSINARFCVSDDAFMFYADKVAEFFGFAKPTRVTMTYILSENTFFLDVVGDPGTEESSNENEIVSLTSSGDESDYDEGDDQLNDYQNQQMIVVWLRLFFNFSLNNVFSLLNSQFCLNGYEYLFHYSHNSSFI